MSAEGMAAEMAAESAAGAAGAAAAAASAAASANTNTPGSSLAAIVETLGLPAAEVIGVPEPAYVALLVVAVVFVFWLLTRMIFGGGGSGGGGGGAGNSSSVLLCGACGAGKTSLFQTLRAGTTFEGTVTSMSENEDRFAVEGKLGKKGVVSKQAHVVDLPGHPRLRAKLDKYVAGAKGVVFLVDAVDFTSQRRAVAEQLFDLLSNPVIQKRKVPILLACNKSEKITAHPVDFVRKRLEKEIEMLRTTCGTLEDTSGGAAGGAIVMGREGEEFQFDHLVKNQVTAVGISVSDDDLAAVKEFIVKAV